MTLTVIKFIRRELYLFLAFISIKFNVYVWFLAFHTIVKAKYPILVHHKFYTKVVNALPSVAAGRTERGAGAGRDA